MSKEVKFKKIINDPLYGFVSVQNPLVLDIIKHKSFQRLRRIRQLGLTEYVYPGAVHTRFHHAIGSMHLMQLALDLLLSKDIVISAEEYEATLVAILLHDVGHGPLSHTLEGSLLNNVRHEELSLMVMEKLNKELHGKLSMAIDVFTGEYRRPFLNQLVSGHFDIDRMDYLKRDSFYTAVSEGNIGIMRLIQMLNVVSDELVIEEKGVNNIESFLMARRFMYWQVYLHKTTVAAEKMIELVLQRATFLLNNQELKATPAGLLPFLKKKITISDFDDKLLEIFLDLDDFDIWNSLKIWAAEKDHILSYLCRSILNRNLFRIVMSNSPLKKEMIDSVKVEISRKFMLGENDAEYLYSTGSIYNTAYGNETKPIQIFTSKGVFPLEEVSDLKHISELGKIVKKYYLSYPKDVSLSHLKWAQF